MMAKIAAVLAIIITFNELDIFATHNGYMAENLSATEMLTLIIVIFLGIISLPTRLLYRRKP